MQASSSLLIDFRGVFGSDLSLILFVFLGVLAKSSMGFSIWSMCLWGLGVGLKCRDVRRVDLRGARVCGVAGVREGEGLGVTCGWCLELLGVWKGFFGVSDIDVRTMQWWRCKGFEGGRERERKRVF